MQTLQHGSHVTSEVGIEKTPYNGLSSYSAKGPQNKSLW